MQCEIDRRFALGLAVDVLEAKDLLASLQNLPQTCLGSYQFPDQLTDLPADRFEGPVPLEFTESLRGLQDDQIGGEHAPGEGMLPEQEVPDAGQHEIRRETMLGQDHFRVPAGLPAIR